MEIISFLKKRRMVSVGDWYFVFAMAAAVVLALFSILGNFFLQNPWLYNIKWILISLSACFTGELYARNIQREVIKRIMIYSTLFLLYPLAWFTSPGLNSPIIAYPFLLVILLRILLPQLESYSLIGVVTLVTLIGIRYQFLHPELYVIESMDLLMVDWAVNLPLIILFIALSLSIYRDAYEKKTRLLMELTRNDYLTGVGNKEFFYHELDACHKKNRVYSLIMIDIDYFKLYNDYYGHLEGDHCLKRVSGCLKRTLEDQGVLFRFGGEEFVALLPEREASEAGRIAMRLHRGIQELQIPHQVSAVSDFLTISVGVATGKREKDPTALLERADILLYQAKAQGRDRVIQEEGVTAR